MAARRARSVAPRGTRARTRRREVRPGWSGPFALAVAAVALGFVTFVAVWFVQPHAGRGVVVRVTVPLPATADGTANALADADVIDRPWLFAWLLRVTGNADRDVEGALPLRDDMSPRAVLRAIVAGEGVLRVTVPEGSTRFEIGARLADAGVVASADAFVRATEDTAALARLGIHGESAEGYLFPDTYDFAPAERPADVVDRFVRTARRRLADLAARDPNAFARAHAAGLDERALLTLASLIERESGDSADRPRVAAVFWNRLTLPEFQPRLLQSDPTVVYGCRASHPPSCRDVPATGRVAITRAMLDDAANPYNTYAHPGLPPGPIANPGLPSIVAALHPAPTHDLYFVAMGNGRSAFATTRAEHEANVQRYLHAPGAIGRDTVRAP